MNKIDFKRDIYFEILNSLIEYNVTFLLGPRKCGKTYALDQIKRDYAGTIIKYDFKTLGEDESVLVVNNIIEDIKVGKHIVYLLDEVTYMTFPEQEIARVAEAYTESKVFGVDIKTKIVFTGSQSVALSSWGRSAFGGQANFIYADFLKYSEWLDYANIKEPSDDSFVKFVMGTFDFYNEFNSLEEYLRGCLEETVKSNAKSRNYIYGNDVDLVDVNDLINILYITLFSLHNTLSPVTFFQNNSLTSQLIYIKNIMAKDYDISSEEIRNRIAESYIGRFDSVKAIGMKELKQSLSFLIRSGLITATPIFDNFETTIDVLKNLEADTSKYNEKSDLLGKVNFTINYPMFYAQILKDIFNGEIEKNGVDRATLGSIAECYIRGLLDDKNSFEYHDRDDNEIDYINIRNKVAIEITISEKDKHKVHLNLAPSGYKKILLSKERNTIMGDIELIPYYRFIYDLCFNNMAYSTSIKPINSNKISAFFTNPNNSHGRILTSIDQPKEQESQEDAEKPEVNHTDS